MMQGWNQACSSQAFEYIKSLLEELERENFSLQLQLLLWKGERLVLLSSSFSLYLKNAHYTGTMLDASTIALCPKLHCYNYVSNPNEPHQFHHQLLLNLNLSTTALVGTEVIDCCITMAIIERYYYDVTPLFWEKVVHIFTLNHLFYGIHVLYTTHSQYIISMKQNTYSEKKVNKIQLDKGKEGLSFCKLSFIFKWLL